MRRKMTRHSQAPDSRRCLDSINMTRHSQASDSRHHFLRKGVASSLKLCQKGSVGIEMSELYLGRSAKQSWQANFTVSSGLAQTNFRGVQNGSQCRCLRLAARRMCLSISRLSKCPGRLLESGRILGAPLDGAMEPPPRSLPRVPPASSSA